MRLDKFMYSFLIKMAVWIGIPIHAAIDYFKSGILPVSLFTFFLGPQIATPI